MGALIQDQLGLEVELIRAGGGEFTVWVDEQQVAGKSWTGFPQDEDCLAAVKKALS